MESPCPTSSSREHAEQLLRTHAVRVTPPRVAIVRLLAGGSRPMTRAEVVQMLGGERWDPATIYRTLVRLSEVGIARVVSRSEGRARYELAVDVSGRRHEHPHFVCTDCGAVACLPDVSVRPELTGRWRESVMTAAIALEGRCPDCRVAEPHSPVGSPNANTES